MVYFKYQQLLECKFFIEVCFIFLLRFKYPLTVFLIEKNVSGMPFVKVCFSFEFKKSSTSAAWVKQSYLDIGLKVIIPIHPH